MVACSATAALLWPLAASRGRGHVLRPASTSAWRDMNDEQAFAETATALEPARASHDDHTELLALRNRALALYHRSELPEGAETKPEDWTAINQRGMTLARRLADSEALGRFLFFEAARRHAQSEPMSELVPSLDASTAIARSGHFDRLLADDERLRGEIEVDDAHGATALAALNEALALYESLHVADEIPRVLSAIAGVYRLPTDASRADLETAASLLRRAVARYEMRFGQGNLATLLLELGMTEQRLGHDTEAEALWRRVIVIADAEPDPHTSGHARFRLGKSLLDRGLPAQALPELEAAMVVLKKAEAAPVLDYRGRLHPQWLGRGRRCTNGTPR